MYLTFPVKVEFEKIKIQYYLLIHDLKKEFF